MITQDINRAVLINKMVERYHEAALDRADKEAELFESKLKDMDDELLMNEAHDMGFDEKEVDYDN